MNHTIEATPNGTRGGGLLQREGGGFQRTVGYGLNQQELHPRPAAFEVMPQDHHQRIFKAIVVC